MFMAVKPLVGDPVMNPSSALNIAQMPSNMPPINKMCVPSAFSPDDKKLSAPSAATPTATVTMIMRDAGLSEP